MHLRSVTITCTKVCAVKIFLVVTASFHFLRITKTQVTLRLLLLVLVLHSLTNITFTTASYSTGIIAIPYCNYYSIPTNGAAFPRRILTSGVFGSPPQPFVTRNTFRLASTTANFRSLRRRVGRRTDLPLLYHWQQYPTMAYHPSMSSSTAISAQHAATDIPPRHEQHSQTQPSSSLSVSKETPIGAVGAVARRVSASPNSLQKCGDRLREGYLVSFPTETVYGLGCHALDPQAVSKVYAAKERPLTDPLIVHVSEISQALPLWDVTRTDEVMIGDCGSSTGVVVDHATTTTTMSSSMDETERNERRYILNLLCHTFWPGPLTIVAPANLQIVPSIVMANTSYVAIRYPSHPIAQCLIRAAGVPIAAPSANKFGHVSPTRPDHVLCDLGMEDVWVIDPSVNQPEENYGNTSTTTSITTPITTEEIDPTSTTTSSSLTRICHVGVESTVIKINFASRTIELLRHGAISPADLEACLDQDADRIHTGTTTLTNSADGTPIRNGCDPTTVRHRYRVEDRTTAKFRLNNPTKRLQDDTCTNNELEDDALQIPQVAPGQAIRHYSPNVRSYMISPNRYRALIEAEDTTPQSLSLTKEEISQLSTSVIIDFGGRLKSLQSYCLDYQDLSADGNAQEGATHIFEVLRWSERIDGADRIYFPQLVVPSQIAQEEVVGILDQGGSGLLLALTDKLNRAASGIVTDTFQ